METQLNSSLGDAIVDDLNRLNVNINALLASELESRKSISSLNSDLSAFRTAFFSSEKDKEALNEALKRLRHEVDQERSELQNKLKGSCVICLIDGDGAIFSNELIKEGRAGGQLAARMLSEATAQYLLSKFSIAHHQLWVYVFLNKRGLLETFRKAGLHGPHTGLDNFIIGFNQASETFLMVDVGDGKEAVDAKMRARLDHDIRLPQTLKVLFGGCSDGGYTTTLRSLMTAGFADKLILLKGYLDMAPVIASLQLPSFAVHGLFRPQKIVVPLSDLATPLPPTHPLVSPTYSSVLQSGTAPVNKPPNQELDLSDNDKGPKQRRVDPTIPLSKQTPPPCNHFYLTNAGCKHGEDCRYAHDYYLDDKQCEELRNNARKAPCPFLNKDEFCYYREDCVYGHVCPSGPNCRFLEQGRCKFIGSEMHNSVD